MTSRSAPRLDTTQPPTLQQVLELEQIEDLLFRGRSCGGTHVRIFGGEVAGQALVAAGRTVPGGRHVNSLHAYFLRPGDPALPLLFRVDPIRDGGSFSTRRVVAIQDGQAVFTLAASFHCGESGFEHQVARFDAPAPDDLRGTDEVLAEADVQTQGWFAMIRDRFPLDIRFPEELPGLSTLRGERSEPRQRIWVRSSSRLGDDPLLHACAATYVSDLFLLASAMPPHGGTVGASSVQLASLDHAVWFHAPFRADDWLLYEQEGSRATSGRGLARGTFFDPTGTHVATVMQEGLMRLPR